MSSLTESQRRKEVKKVIYPKQKKAIVIVVEEAQSQESVVKAQELMALLKSLGYQITFTNLEAIDKKVDSNQITQILEKILLEGRNLSAKGVY